MSATNSPVPFKLHTTHNDVIVGDVLGLTDVTPAYESIGSKDSEDYYVIVDVIKTVVLLVIVSIAVFGNALVIVSVSRTSKLRTVANAFLVSLAFADLLVALLVMTFSASQEIRGDWLWGEFACDVFNANDVMLSTASLLHLCCISIDRYIAIMDPFHYTTRITGTRVTHMLLVTWSVSALVSHIPIHMRWYAVTSVNGTVDVLVPVEPSDVTSSNGSSSSSSSSSDRVRCVFTANKPYCLLSSTISFWLPAVLMLVIYAQIYREADRQKVNMRRLALGITASVICRRVKVTQVLDAAAKVLQQQNSDDVTTPSGDKTAANQSNFQSEDGATVNDVTVNTDNAAAVDTTVSIPTPKPAASTSASFDGVGIAYNNFVNTSSVQLIHSSCSFEETSNNAKRATFSTANNDLKSSTRRSDEPLRNRRQQSMTSSRKSTSLRSVRSEHKAAQTLGIIMGGFLCCWLPFFSWYAIVTLCDNCPTPPTLVSALFWIGYANSAVNPAVYALHNRDFRLAFLRQLGCNRLLLRKRQKLAAATLYD